MVDAVKAAALSPMRPPLPPDSRSTRPCAPLCADARHPGATPRSRHSAKSAVKVQLSLVPGDQVVRLIYRAQAMGLTLQQWDMTDESQPGMWTGSASRRAGP